MKAYRICCLFCTAEISPEKVLMMTFPHVPFFPHTYQPTKLLYEHQILLFPSGHTRLAETGEANPI